jgi:predicted PolB exonuclease-like 3'-5' exonuclease
MYDPLNQGDNIMLSGLFQSKNQKLVARWKKEHLKMVELAHKILGEYAKGKHAKAKKYLKEFSDIGIDHIVSEDIEFFKLLRDHEYGDMRTEKMIEDFKESFGDTKETLMKFLGKYTVDSARLDEAFFEGFNGIVKVLVERIEYEESNLYFRLSLS